MTNNSFIIMKMANKTIEFILGQNSLVFENKLNEVSDTDPLFGRLLSKEDIEDFYVTSEKEKINYSDLFHLRVNVKHIGSFDFFFKQEGLDKNAVIEGVSKLKEITVENKEQAKEKVNALYDSIKGSNPLFMLYSPKGEFALEKGEIESDIISFFVLIHETPKPLIEKKEKVKKEVPNNFIGKLALFFSPIKENPIHYAFILVSVFLIGFSTSIGIYYCYSGNNVFYFLFICALVGAILNYVVYYDFFKKHILSSNDFTLTIIDVAVATALPVAGFFVFYAVQKEKPESLNSPLVILLLTFAIIFVVNMLTCSVAWLVRKKRHK